MPKKPHTPESAAQAALEQLRDALAACPGGEEAAYEAFFDAVSGELAGWEMRLGEIRAEQDDPE